MVKSLSFAAPALTLALSRREKGLERSCLCAMGILFFVIFASTAIAQTPATQPEGPPRLIFGVLISPGIAPCAIHVDGLRFALSAGTQLTAEYDWDFGDPKSRFNLMRGFNAAHVYDHAGRFTIRLIVTDETGRMQETAATIVISPDARRRIFVSPEGSDQNAGNLPDAPFRSLSRAMKALGAGGGDVLLKAGASFNVDATLNIKARDVLIGRYDDGADPTIIRTKGSAGSTFSIDEHSDGILIQDVIFDSPYAADPAGQAPKVGVSAIRAGGRNIAVRDCTFLNLDDAVNANGSPQGLLVQDCSAPLVTGLRGYFLWGQGTQLVCMGNTVANSTREHNVRISGADRMLICYNTFANLDRRPGDKYDESKGCIELHKSANGYVAHNAVTSGPIRVGPLGLNEDPGTATDWVVIEGNTLTGTKIAANPGSHHIMIRNNIVRNEHDQAMVISGPDKQGRTCGDITIINNTAINNSDSGAFLKLWGHVDGIILKNNLFVAPGLKPGINGTAAVNTVETDLGSFIEIERNLWPLPAKFVGKTHDGVCVVGQKDADGYRNAAQWGQFSQVKEDRFLNVAVNERGLPAWDSAAIGYALPIPGLWRDHDDRLRAVRTSTVGALEVVPATSEPVIQNQAK